MKKFPNVISFRAIVKLVAIVGVGILAVVIADRLFRTRAGSVNLPEIQPNPLEPAITLGPEAGSSGDAVAGPLANPTQATRVQPGRPAPSPAIDDKAQQLISLMASAEKPDSLTPEQAEVLKKRFEELVAQGSGAVPAIRAYLEKQQDIAFGNSTLGVPTLRTGLIEALRQIGGPEAIEAIRQTGTTTVNPLEIAVAARAMEELAPGRFRQDALNSALASFNLAANGQLKGRDISPLLELFHAYGDSGVSQELQRVAQTGKWINYLPYVMAELPDGAGIDSLLALANNPEVSAKDPQNAVLRSLAVAALDQPQALAALEERTRQNQITDAAWGRVAAVLGGDSYRPYPGTVFGDGAEQTTLTADQISKRQALIDKLLAATSNPAAVQALRNARDRLGR